MAKDRQRIKEEDSRGRVRCKRGQWVRSAGRYYTCHDTKEAAFKSKILTGDVTALSISVWKKG